MDSCTWTCQCRKTSKDLSTSALYERKVQPKRTARIMGDGLRGSQYDLMKMMMISSPTIMSRVFANCPEDQGSIPCRVIPKTQKMLLDAALLNTQHYKVWIKGNVEKSREWRSALPYTSVWQLLKREPSGRLRLRAPTLLILLITRILSVV